jgi:hypothetical protein
VNVENLKLFEPPMIMDQDEEVSIPSVDEFVLDLKMKRLVTLKYLQVLN